MFTVHPPSAVLELYYLTANSFFKSVTEQNKTEQLQWTVSVKFLQRCMWQAADLQILSKFISPVYCVLLCRTGNWCCAQFKIRLQLLDYWPASLVQQLELIGCKVIRYTTFPSVMGISYNEAAHLSPESFNKSSSYHSCHFSTIIIFFCLTLWNATCRPSRPAGSDQVLHNHRDNRLSSLNDTNEQYSILTWFTWALEMSSVLGEGTGTAAHSATNPIIITVLAVSAPSMTSFLYCREAVTPGGCCPTLLRYRGGMH